MKKLTAAIAAIVATGMDFVILLVLVRLFGAPTFVSAVIAATTGGCINFVFQRYFVFKARSQRKREQLPKYLLVAASTILISASVTTLFMDVLGLHELVGRALAAVIVFYGWHYPLARRVFRTSRPSSISNIEFTENIGGEAMEPYVSVIIPAFNEQERLPTALADVKRVIKGWPFDVEVIVVNDGSSDGTDGVVRIMQETMPQLRLISYSPNRGKGHAVRVGVMKAAGDIVLFMDADNSVPLDHATKLIERLEAGADAAIGSRYVEPSATVQQQPWYRVAWSRVTNFVVQRALLRGVQDTQCGFKAFRAQPARKVFSQTTIAGWGFDLEVLTLFDRMGSSIVEVPVVFTDDRRTKIDPLKDAVGVVKDFLRVQRNLFEGRYDLT